MRVSYRLSYVRDNQALPMHGVLAQLRIALTAMYHSPIDFFSGMSEAGIVHFPSVSDKNRTTSN